MATISKEYHRDYVRKYRKDPSKKFILQEKAKRSNHKRRCKQFGITPEIFEAVFMAQGRRCAICETMDSGPRDWCVDHDHVTNQFRGILCARCNLGLGQFKDSQLSLYKAIEYLKKFEGDYDKN